MRKFNYKNLEVTEYNIIRMTGYVTENAKFYAPSDMVFYQIEDFNNKIEFEGKVYSQKAFVGITTYSKEKEKISHNFHWDICGKKDDYPVVNSLSVNVSNIANKYLIWHLKSVDINDEFPISTEKPSFSKPIYLMKSAKTEEQEILREIMEGYIDESKVAKMDLDRKLYRPYLYIKVHGLNERGDSLDCTSIMTGSWCAHDDIKIFKIERENFDFDNLELGYHRHENVCLSSKKEFENEYKKMIKAFEI